MSTWFVVLTGWMLLALSAVGDSSGVELSPFTKILSCVPLSVSVRPKGLTDNYKYGLKIEGEAAQVQDALRYNVKNGTLRLSLSGTVSIKTSLHVSIFLPDTKLEAIENRGAGVLLVDSGFDVKEIGIKASPGKIRVDRIYADKVFAETKGIGMVVVHGIFQKAVLDADDISTIAIKGVQRKVHVNAGGTSKIYIMGEKHKRIDGRVHWFGKVFADASESCTLTSAGVFEGRCERLIQHEVPVIERLEGEHLEFVGEASCDADSSSRSASAQVTESSDGRFVSSSSSSHSSSRSSRSSSASAHSSSRSSSSSSASAHSSSRSSSSSSASAHGSSYSSSSASSSARGSGYSSSSVSVHTSSGGPKEDKVTVIT